MSSKNHTKANHLLARLCSILILSAIFMQTLTAYPQSAYARGLGVSKGTTCQQAT